jgi:hypothetical protein
MYMTSLTQLRTLMARSPYFARIRTDAANKNGSVLPTLTSQGNLLAGATTRVAVGFLLNPFSVLKARFEVRGQQYPAQRGCSLTEGACRATEQHLRVPELLRRAGRDRAPGPVGAPARVPGVVAARRAVRRPVRRVL